MATPGIKTIETLVALAQLDLETARAYETAARYVDDEMTVLAFTTLRADHELHAQALARLLARAGENLPEMTITVGLRMSYGAASVKGALMAMRANEQLTNRMYRAVGLGGLDPDVAELVRRHREDEARHLAEIERILHSAPLRSPELPFRRHEWRSETWWATEILS